MGTRILSIIAILLLFTGCMNAQKKGTNGKMLIIYFSRTGNTEMVAKHIQELTGADMVKLEPFKAYPEDRHEAEEIAKVERDNNARPKIKERIENFDQYDTIFLGFPIWWNTHPMVIATFLESYDLEGKTIVLFCTHGGGGGVQGFKDVKALAPEVNYIDGLSLRSNHAISARSDIEKWLKEIKVGQIK